jgi:hypothetical protein
MGGVRDGGLCFVYNFLTFNDIHDLGARRGRVW